jgi:hypothetical protein
MGLQERIEASRGGRVAISAFLGATLFFVCVTNMPQSRLRTDVMKVGSPYLNSIGLDQDWRVFAPDPRRVTIDMFARVRYADGRLASWRSPRGGALLGQYWDYRWRKWMENAILDENERELWEPTARYVIREEEAKGRSPASVTLVRRWWELLPPGRGPERGPARQYAYFRYLPER